jgi:hypothetical protein
MRWIWAFRPIHSIFCNSKLRRNTSSGLCNLSFCTITQWLRYACRRDTLQPHHSGTGNLRVAIRREHRHWHWLPSRRRFHSRTQYRPHTHTYTQRQLCTSQKSSTATLAPSAAGYFPPLLFRYASAIVIIVELRHTDTSNCLRVVTAIT